MQVFVDFDLLSANTGWIWIDNRVYWTTDAGGNWSDLTPNELSSGRILAVHFSTTGSRWILWSSVSASGNQEMKLSHADLPDFTWKTTNVHVFTPAQPGFDPVDAGIFWLDENTGWVSVKFRSSSSVSTGTSFRTMDGGITWQESSIPIGGPLKFSPSQVGWLAGGAAGDELYRSIDGGNSWTEFTLSALPGVIVQTYLPVFDDNRTGLLPILVRDSSNYQMVLFESQDDGLNWQALGSIPLGNVVDPAVLQVSVMDTRHAGVLDPSGRFFLLDDRQVTSFDSGSTYFPGITSLDMFDSLQGWAVSNMQDCTPIIGALAAGGKSSYNCLDSSRLLQTRDGGRSWEALVLPAGMGSSLLQVTQVVPRFGMDAYTIQSNEVRITTQGFDSCVPGTVSQMQDWWNNSPYYAWNIYVGGSNRGCNAINQATLTKSFISQVRSQGWYFIPTWVGLQASCSSGNFWKMSSNSATAYNQGVNEANEASDVMAALGFSGSIIYFDLEAFNMADTTCVNAARSFVNGWTTQLHNRGNLSGLYAMAYEVDNYYTIANRPDGIWMAGGGTKYTSYNPAATVWGNKYVSDDLWNGIRRIYQYTTGHYETWGSTSMNIDCDAVNGIVAVPGSDDSCQAPTLISPADEFVSPGQTVSFNWQAPTGCSFDGYSLRIKDVPDMNVGGTLILDVTTENTSRSVTIDPEWVGQDLYWGVRTNFPYSPNWSVHSFQIGVSPSCSINDDQAALFTGLNYSGTCVVRDIGEYPNAAAMEIVDNDISSVLVGSNVSLQLCREEEFAGICETFYGDDPNLVGNIIGDDQASSALVTALPVSVTLFADTNFGGESCQQNGVGWNNACTTLNNQASSIQVLEGWSSRVWSGPDLKGESLCITADTASFSGLNYNENGISALDNTISSFAAYDQPTCPPLLSINLAGSGSGTISSNPAGINCGSTCSAAFPDDSYVTLTGSASSGSTFTGWSGGVCSGASPCTVRMSEARNVTATFTSNAYTLNIIKSGSGTITSSPGGLNCGPVCSYSFPYNTTVSLYTAATPGSNFSSWGGACGGSGSCSVLLDGDKTVNANFVYDINTLSVSKSGNGTVSSSPPGIDCGANCAAPFTYPTTVKLTAEPLSGSIFSGWSGYCSGLGVCSVPMTSNRSVTANFSAGGVSLLVDKSGSGTGTITSIPAGINCGSTCGYSFTEGEQVTLNASPDSNLDRFTGWSGACSGLGACVVTMSESRSVTAGFERSAFGDVPFDYSEVLGGVTYNLHDHIQVLYEHGLTIGTSVNPPLYSPTMQLDRAMAAVFMMRAKFGTGYQPPLEPFDAFGADDWSLNGWARSWAEGMWDVGLTAGCQSDPLQYCPDETLPRVQAVIFALRMKYDTFDGQGNLVEYQPPPATGLVFADMTDVDFYGTAWAEQAYLDGLLPICGMQDDKPLFCPHDPVNRAWAAYLIVMAQGLPLP